jgi:hypothetical protein
MNTKELPSGRTLVVNVAPYEAANKLRRVILAELGRVTIPEGLKIDAKLFDSELLSADGATLSALKSLASVALSSEVIERAMFECAGRSTIDNEAIKPGSFERPETRGDLIPVAWEVIKSNVGPFFAGLDLSSLIRGPRASGSPPSE